jgi:predicted O-methyltransferase YrrM
MDSTATLLTVDSEPRYVEVAKRHMGNDPRVTFHVDSGDAFLRNLRGSSFDLIFADTWPGKFDHLPDAINLLRIGGLYLIDDLLPQANWPAGHAPRVPALVSELERDPRLVSSKLSWSSGLLVARGGAQPKSEKELFPTMSDESRAPKHIVSAAVIVSNSAGEVLLTKTPRRGWEMPGG